MFGMKYCPLLNKECLEEQCMWYYKDEKKCAILVIAVGSIYEIVRRELFGINLE